MISVVIPTRNRANFLDSALESILKQEFHQSKFEVIVVDNGSIDFTQEVIGKYRLLFKKFKAIHIIEPGLHNGRHAGMKASKGEVLLFADDDIEALPTWLMSIQESFEDKDVVMVGGNNEPLFMRPPPAWIEQLWRMSNFKGYKSIPELSIIKFHKSVSQISPHLVWGCNFAIRKSTLIAAGGFHPDAMPKEMIRFRGDGESHVSDYVERSGLKCLFHPGASVYHKVTPERMTFAYFRERGFNQGVSASFSQLRNKKRGSSTANADFFKRVFACLRRKLCGILDSAEVRQALNSYQVGYKEGFEYHQRIYATDADVREWVHRPIYF